MCCSAPHYHPCSLDNFIVTTLMCSLRPQKEKGSGHPSPHQSRKQSQFSAKYCKTVPCNFSSLPFLPVVPTVPLQTHSCSLCVGSVFADVPPPFFTVSSPAYAHRRATSLPHSCSLCVGSVFADVPQPFFTVASPADAHRRATSLPLSLLNHLLAYLHTWASGSLRTCKWFSNSRCNLQFTFFLCSTHSALLRSTAGREKEGASDMSTATSTYTHSTKNLMSSVHICNDVFSYALQLAERPSHTTTGAPAWLS